MIAYAWIRTLCCTTSLTCAIPYSPPWSNFSHWFRIWMLSLGCSSQFCVVNMCEAACVISHHTLLIQPPSFFPPLISTHSLQADQTLHLPLLSKRYQKNPLSMNLPFIAASVIMKISTNSLSSLIHCLCLPFTRNPPGGLQQQSLCRTARTSVQRSDRRCKGRGASSPLRDSSSSTIRRLSM